MYWNVDLDIFNSLIFTYSFWDTALGVYLDSGDLIKLATKASYVNRAAAIPYLICFSKCEDASLQRVRHFDIIASDSLTIERVTDVHAKGIDVYMCGTGTVLATSK